jgi:hypothetical protein
MLEAEWRQVLRGSMSTGTREDESTNGRFWAAGFHHVMGRTLLVHILKITNRIIYLIFKFFGGRIKPQILSQWIWEHACNCVIGC